MLCGTCLPIVAYKSAGSEGLPSAVGLLLFEAEVRSYFMLYVKSFRRYTTPNVLSPPSTENNMQQLTLQLTCQNGNANEATPVLVKGSSEQ